jgi:hypothetical protein
MPCDLCPELYKKIEKDINYAANIIKFDNITDKEDFKQDCWLGIFSFVDRNSKISRLSAKFIIQKNSTKFFTKNSYVQVDDIENIVKCSDYADIADEIIQKADNVRRKETINLIEEKLGYTRTPNLVNPAKISPLGDIKYKNYRKFRNQYEYYENKSVETLKKFLKQSGHKLPSAGAI